jgi:hypothetical protein
MINGVEGAVEWVGKFWSLSIFSFYYLPHNQNAAHDENYCD